jgi:hypothetical protein
MVNHKTSTASRLKISILWLCILALIVCSYQVVGMINQNRLNKSDYAELHDIRYGLFNANEWAKIVSTLITEKISEYNRDPEVRANFSDLIVKALDVIIVEVEKVNRRHNTSGTGIKLLFGTAKQYLTDIMIDIEEIRGDIPQITETMIRDLDTEETKENIRAYITHAITDFTDHTGAQIDSTRFQKILKKYSCETREEWDQLNQLQVRRINRTINIYAIFIFVLCIIIYSMIGFSKDSLTGNSIIALVVTCITLLVGGISTPMIEIIAKISEFKFVLLGNPILFTNEVLYFQSKSILDIVHVLLSTGALNIILVGSLIFLFSVLLPIAKMMSTLLYYFDYKNMAQSKYIHFLTFKSGKWSMADVMVIAIFMAYIAFNGILEDQLGRLEVSKDMIHILTTNGTSLQGGFFMFLGFCIGSLLLSSLIEYKSKRIPTISADDSPGSGL